MHLWEFQAKGHLISQELDDYSFVLVNVQHYHFHYYLLWYKNQFLQHYHLVKMRVQMHQYNSCVHIHHQHHHPQQLELKLELHQKLSLYLVVQANNKMSVEALGLLLDYKM